ncbi:hypothetical protein DPMN_120948 [Dreissena polymorpha]|uniref:Uncharacterized protein n=1 Tax=Dreissena polymorpha TaxID=45954 RepID=A0A9D4JQN1_DREPO|nr:hypothetical protein DPMN_120948 [Dreissena polymorpha]
MDRIVKKTSTTIRSNWTPVFFRAIPDQKRTTTVRPYLKLRWRRKCVVSRQENLQESPTSLLNLLSTEERQRLHY